MKDSLVEYKITESLKFSCKTHQSFSSIFLRLTIIAEYSEGIQIFWLILLYLL